jgi:flagellar protein FlaG
MGIHIAVAGNGIPQQDTSQKRVPVFSRPAEIKTILPGSGKNRQRLETLSAAADMERVAIAFNKKLKFVVDHTSYEVTVKVIDPVTDKVIKILPPEELQRLHRRLKDTIGVLFDEKI